MNPSLEFWAQFRRIDLHAGFSASTSTESKLRISAASTSTPALPHPLPRNPSLEFLLLAGFAASTFTESKP
jgi:hypothetical protein